MFLLDVTSPCLHDVFVRATRDPECVVRLSRTDLRVGFDVAYTPVQNLVGVLTAKSVIAMPGYDVTAVMCSLMCSLG